MKQRNGFVSNSSSSSFIVHKDGLNEEQLKELRNYVEFFSLLGGECEASEYTKEIPPWYFEDEDDGSNVDDPNIFQFYIDYCLNYSEIIKFFKQKYGNNVEDVY